MTNKIIFSSEEQKKIDDARARFNVWRESLGCANGSLIVYGTVTQQYYTKRNDPLWWLTDVVSGIDGKSLELPGPSYAKPIYIGTLKPDEGREVEGKRVSAVIELAHEIELAKNGYRLQARILKTPDREPNWKALQSTLSRMQTLQQAIEALKKDRANALKETNRAKKDLEKCDFEIQRKIKEVSDLNKQMTAAKRELEILNKKRTFLGFEDTSSEEQRSNALGVKLTLMDIAERAHAALTTAGGIYSIDLIRDFTALLATQDLIVLSGSSGSGKTSLCREYARVTGSICHVIPVKPNWTSAEDLLGFYSPIEKRYLKTPFLNALLEASKDPSHLHIICLDEMNLARPEYYFADFLSVLETRSSNRLLELNMPEIDSRIRTRIHDVLNALPDAIALNADISTVLSDGSIKKALYDIFAATNDESFVDAWEHFHHDLEQVVETAGMIQIPDNVRFIGTMNVDETTNFFAPKILDRAHILHLDNPLFVQHKDVQQVEHGEPFVTTASSFDSLKPYPNYDEKSPVVSKLKHLGEHYFIPLRVDISLRTMRQAQLYEEKARSAGLDEQAIIGNVLRHKLLPKCVFEFDGADDEGLKTLEALLDDVNLQLPTTCVDEISRLVEMGKKTRSANWWQL